MFVSAEVGEVMAPTSEVVATAVEYMELNMSFDAAAPCVSMEPIYNLVQKQQAYIYIELFGVHYSSSRRICIIQLRGDASKNTISISH